MTQAFHFKFFVDKEVGEVDLFTVNQEVHYFSNLLCVLDHVSDDNGELFNISPTSVHLIKEWVEILRSLVFFLSKPMTKCHKCSIKQISCFWGNTCTNGE